MLVFKEKHKIEEENMKLKLKLERAIEHRPILLQTATSINTLITTVTFDRLSANDLLNFERYENMCNLQLMCA